MLRHALPLIALCLSCQTAIGREGPTPLQQAIHAHAQGDLATAQARFTALAQQGVPAAMHDLAVMHLRGEATPASPRLAEYWFSAAAQRGFVLSMAALGELYESGRLGRRDLARALQAYEAAGEAGSTEAQVAAGTAHQIGRAHV